MNYGERLKMYRKHAGLTQRQLAEKIGSDNTTISRWENGNYHLDVEKLGDLAIALNITVNDLIGFKADFSLDEKEEQILGIFRKLTDEDKDLLFKMGNALLSLDGEIVKRSKRKKKRRLK